MSARRAMGLGAGGALVVILIAAGLFYATESHSSWPPSDAAVKRMLRKLPYRFVFRAVKVPKGASGAVAGRVIGPHKTVVNFGIALGGKGGAVPVPHAGTLNAVGGTAFIVTDDTLIRGTKENGNREGNFAPGHSGERRAK